MGNSQSATPTVAHQPPQSQQQSSEQQKQQQQFQNEQKALDALAEHLPHVIDEASQQQVADYRQACNDGKGPAAACFATAEYVSLFERKHSAAAELYRNVCFRPATDKSPNLVILDDKKKKKKSKSYPAGCYNLSKMYFTGKGVDRIDRVMGYELADRACRGGHGGACYLQAQVLTASNFAELPRNPARAAELYQRNCEAGDSISCFTLANMLLRGNDVAPGSTHKAPQPNSRSVSRDVARAQQLLHQACDHGQHVTSCHNLAVLYTHGDEGVAADPDKAAVYKRKTQEGLELFGKTVVE